MFDTSSTESPVTQLAEVDVKRASTKFNESFFEETGNINRNVPIKIKDRKPYMEIRAGDFKDWTNHFFKERSFFIEFMMVNFTLKKIVSVRKFIIDLHKFRKRYITNLN